MPTCSECGAPLGADADPRRRTCSGRCRMVRMRRLRAARDARLLDLLARYRAAATAGDLDTARALGRDLESLTDADTR